MTVTSTARDRASATNPGMSPGFTATFSPIRAVPALPGAISTSAPSPASFQARACSRPPLPTTRTRREGPATGNDPFGNGERAGDDSDLRRRVVRSATSPEGSRLPEGGRDANRRSRSEEKEGRLPDPRVSADSASRRGVRADQPALLPEPSLRRRGKERWETCGWGRIRGPRALLDVDSHSPADTVGREFVKKITNSPRALNSLISVPMRWLVGGPSMFGGVRATKVREGFGLTW